MKKFEKNFFQNRHYNKFAFCPGKSSNYEGEQRCQVSFFGSQNFFRTRAEDERSRAWGERGGTVGQRGSGWFQRGTDHPPANLHWQRERGD